MKKNQKAPNLYKEIKNLQEILDKYKNKRVIVVGTTCTGKSTLMKNIKNAEDLDKLVFSRLTKKEKYGIIHNPRNKKIIKKMTHLVKEKIKVKKGKPVFGTEILNCDIIIYLKINDELLRLRCEKRKIKFQYAKKMDKAILNEINKSKKETIVFNVG